MYAERWFFCQKETIPCRWKSWGIGECAIPGEKWLLCRAIGILQLQGITQTIWEWRWRWPAQTNGGTRKGSLWKVLESCLNTRATAIRAASSANRASRRRCWTTKPCRVPECQTAPESTTRLVFERHQKGVFPSRDEKSTPIRWAIAQRWWGRWIKAILWKLLLLQHLPRFRSNRNGCGVWPNGHAKYSTRWPRINLLVRALNISRLKWPVACLCHSRFPRLWQFPDPPKDCVVCALFDNNNA